MRTNELPACGPTATTLPAIEAFSRLSYGPGAPFIERRLSEEQSEFELLSASNFPRRRQASERSFGPE